MFERFTTDAREIVTRAQQEATELKHPRIGTEHLLLAMAQGGGPAASVLHGAGVTTQRLRAGLAAAVAPAATLFNESEAQALRSVGIDVDAVLARIEQSFGPDALRPAEHSRRGWFGRGGRTGAASGFSPRAKKVIELALREAIRMKDKEINSGHLLLGLLRDGEGLAAKLLVDGGADLAVLRARTEQLLRQRAA